MKTAFANEFHERHIRYSAVPAANISDSVRIRIEFAPELDYSIPVTSVADPGCLSRIPDPGFYPSRIPDPKTATKERGEKNLLSCLFCSHKFHKLENYFIFEMPKKKFGPIFEEL